jgi:hypothetical protein
VSERAWASLVGAGAPEPNSNEKFKPKSIESFRKVQPSGELCLQT